MSPRALALEWGDAPEPSGSGDVMWAEIYQTPEGSGYGHITSYACGPKSTYGKSGTTGGQNLGGGDRLGTRYIYFADTCGVSQAPSHLAFNRSTYVFTLSNGYTRYAGALVAPTTTTTTTSTSTSTTTIPPSSLNPCKDPANPRYACGWANVSDSGAVGNVIVCTFDVCGSGFFGGRRYVLQTRQEVGGNVAGYNSGAYDFATNRFYPNGLGGSWFTGGDTWEGIRASLAATGTTTTTSTSTTVKKTTTTTEPESEDNTDTTTTTVKKPSTRTTTTTTTTTIAPEVDDGESEEDFAELSVRQQGSQYKVQVFSSFPNTDMVIRARSAGRTSITWRLTTTDTGRHQFLTNRKLKGYTISLWIDDERVDSLKISR